MAASSLPFECELDIDNCVENVSCFRVALNTDGDAYEWLTSYGVATRTTWIVDWEVAKPKRIAFHKKWKCQHSNRNKITGQTAPNCPAFVDIKIKNITRDTRKRDPFLKRDTPLRAIVKVRDDHNHALDCADALRLLRTTADTRAVFHSYFHDGLTPAQAIAMHQQKLEAEDDAAEKLASGAVNPSAGADVRTTRSEDGTCWAVLVVTQVMKRTQGLSAAKEIIFVDSTASCDESQSSLTVVLTATAVGAMPLAVLLHSSQSSESYKAAFGLLKLSYPTCFRGTHAPQAFMTDNSAAEKAALQATWPEGKQLLCHFHVAQAEWRWLHASRDTSRDDKRDLMTTFQKIMYASTANDLNTTIAEMKAKSHKGYVARVLGFLERKAEWVLLYRSGMLTRGHTTNNFAEASIRVLKDVVLGRHKAFNVVALVDLIRSLWEGHLQKRLLKHAYNRVPSHKLLYDKLLERMPENAAASIRTLGSNLFEVPSCTEDGKIYEVWQDVGTCTCRAGQQGAFCKHQALVHSTYGGGFPNAPILSTQDRHQLAWLALGDKCQNPAFFRDFRESAWDQPGSGSGEPGNDPVQPQPQPLVQDATSLPQDTMEVEEQLAVAGPSSNHQCREDAAEVLKNITEELWRQYSLAADNPFYLTLLQRDLALLKRARTEPQVVAMHLASTAAKASSLRCGRIIKVQPIGLARRRPGVTRGAARVHAGRPLKTAGSRKTKRLHSLHLSVKDAVPHAKSHGTGH
ncbi:uncharacterized protein LOC144098184 [Amblyomma americanum]